MFDFQMGRGRQSAEAVSRPLKVGPDRWLRRFRARVGGPGVIPHTACRRMREEEKTAAKLHPSDAVTLRIVAGIDELFAMDGQASGQNSITTRRQLRRQKKPLLEKAEVVTKSRPLFAAP